MGERRETGAEDRKNGIQCTKAQKKTKLVKEWTENDGVKLEWGMLLMARDCTNRIKNESRIAGAK